MKSRAYKEAYIQGRIEQKLQVIFNCLRTNLLPDDMLVDLTGITQIQLEWIRSILEGEDEAE